MGPAGKENGNLIPKLRNQEMEVTSHVGFLGPHNRAYLLSVEKVIPEVPEASKTNLAITPPGLALLQLTHPTGDSVSGWKQRARVGSTVGKQDEWAVKTTGKRKSKDSVEGRPSTRGKMGKRLDVVEEAQNLLAEVGSQLRPLQ